MCVGVCVRACDCVHMHECVHACVCVLACVCVCVQEESMAQTGWRLLLLLLLWFDLTGAKVGKGKKGLKVICPS